MLPTVGDVVKRRSLFDLLQDAISVSWTRSRVAVATDCTSISSYPILCRDKLTSVSCMKFCLDTCLYRLHTCCIDYVDCLGCVDSTSLNKPKQEHVGPHRFPAQSLSNDGNVANARGKDQLKKKNTVSRLKSMEIERRKRKNQSPEKMTSVQSRVREFHSLHDFPENLLSAHYDRNQFPMCFHYIFSCSNNGDVWQQILALPQDQRTKCAESGHDGRYQIWKKPPEVYRGASWTSSQVCCCNLLTIPSASTTSSFFVLWNFDTWICRTGSQKQNGFQSLPVLALEVGVISPIP